MVYDFTTIFFSDVFYVYNTRKWNKRKNKKKKSVTIVLFHKQQEQRRQFSSTFKKKFGFAELGIFEYFNLNDWSLKGGNKWELTFTSITLKLK